VKDFNPHLQGAILDIVDNQIRDNDPPETLQTLTRLKNAGHSEDEARKLIAAVVAVEIYDVLKQGRPFDPKRFVGALNKLPHLPYEDNE
jgi:hypothetical protein